MYHYKIRVSIRDTSFALWRRNFCKRDGRTPEGTSLYTILSVRVRLDRYIMIHGENIEF